MAPASRKDYDQALTPLTERFGRLMVADMPRQFVFKLCDEYSTMPAMTRHKTPRPIKDAQGKQVILETPRRADRMVDVLRLWLAWAENRGGWTKKNIALRPGRLEIGPGIIPAMRPPRRSKTLAFLR